MSQPVRVRFAPSPTGSLHVGNARTALYNYLFARGQGGELVLRIDDTDLDREKSGAEEAIYEDLRWMGIHWEEGPDKDGEKGPYRQSERLQLYKDYAESLMKKGQAYPCFCSEETLKAKRKEAERKGRAPRYDGFCRNLTEEEQKERIDKGESYTVRFKVPFESIAFEDLVRKKVVFHGKDIGDFVLLRSTGVASYNLASTIDDHLMGITHVIRGEDHLSNTPRQIALSRELGFPLPLFGHLSTVLGPDRARLSKRHGATSIKEIQEAGLLSEGFVNYLLLLGWAPEKGREVLTLEEMVDSFSLDRVSKSPSVFDYKKLAWINGHHLKSLDGDLLYEEAKPFLQGEKEVGLKERVLALRDNVDNLKQFKEYLSIFDQERFKVSEEAALVLADRANTPLIEKMGEFFRSLEKINSESCAQMVSTLKGSLGLGGKKLFMPIRCVITGMTRGPELDKIVPLLKKEQLIERVESALGALKES